MADFGLEMDVEEKSGVAVIRLNGRIDATSSLQLEKKLDERIDRGDKEIAFDFKKVDYLSSAGMRLLLSGTKKLKNGGGFLALFSLPEGVMEIIKMAGFEKILRIHADEDEFFESLGK